MFDGLEVAVGFGDSSMEMQIAVSVLDALEVDFWGVLLNRLQTTTGRALLKLLKFVTGPLRENSRPLDGTVHGQMGGLKQSSR